MLRQKVAQMSNQRLLQAMSFFFYFFLFLLKVNSKTRLSTSTNTQFKWSHEGQEESRNAYKGIKHCPFIAVLAGIHQCWQILILFLPNYYDASVICMNCLLQHEFYDKLHASIPLVIRKKFFFYDQGYIITVKSWKDYLPVFIHLVDLMVSHLSVTLSMRSESSGNQMVPVWNTEHYD